MYEFFKGALCYFKYSTESFPLNNKKPKRVKFYTIQCIFLLYLLAFTSYLSKQSKNFRYAMREIFYTLQVYFQVKYI